MNIFKLPKKKFKLRLIYNRGYGHGRWNVEYAYYRWIPNWDTIDEYDSFGRSDKWFSSSESAESFAIKLNSIEDVDNFNQQQLDRYFEYLAEKAEHYKTRYVK